MKAARDRAGLKPEEVALRMGLGLRALQKYEYGESVPTVKRLEHFAEIVGVPLSSLLADKVYELSDRGAIPLHMVPVLNRIPAGGFVLGFDDSPVEEHIYSAIKDPNAFALRVVGDSMSPKIDEGDLVVLSPEREFEDNRIYAVVTDDSAHTLKTVRRVNGGYWLLPFNPNYNPELVPDGRMVKLIRVPEIRKSV